MNNTLENGAQLDFVGGRSDCVQHALITPDEALALLTEGKYEGQRAVKDLTVKRYAELMTSGKWGVGETAIVVGVRAGTKHLLNGQHRLNAVIESGTAQMFIVQYRHFGSDADMDRAYAIMDNGYKRSPRQGFIAMGTPDRLGVTLAQSEAAVAAMRIILGNFRKPNNKSSIYQALISTDAQDELLMLWGKEIYSYCHCIKSAHKGAQCWFMRSPVMAVGLVTIRYAPALATEFWTKAAANNGLLRGEPEHTLYNYLTMNSSASRSHAYHAYAVAACWNAYTKKRELNRAMGFDDRIISINQTPFRGEDDIDIDAILYSAADKVTARES